MSFDNNPKSIDCPFSVPFVHRLRFTEDVFGADQQVLADVLEPPEGQTTRVQFWVDSGVAECQADLTGRIDEFCRGHADRIRPVGQAQIVPGGEKIKNDVHIFEGMLNEFNACDLDRRSYVIVIGGGAVLDAVGFAAAIAHRGLRLVRLPSSTLGQGDSGVGVKNGVNLFSKKNWLGVFAPPWAVINDAHLLATLSDRDFISGFSESVKVAILKDSDMFDRLCQHAKSIRERNMDAAWPLIRESAQMHLDHITQGGDPFEMLEARPLDFGHWSAHKLEVMSQFRLRHGEAVAIGVAIDSVYASLALGFPESDAERVLQCLDHMGLPLGHPQLHDTELLFTGLEEFRQHLGGRLTLTMPQAVGNPVDVHEVDKRLMQQAVRRVLEFARQMS